MASSQPPWQAGFPSQERLLTTRELCFSLQPEHPDSTVQLLSHSNLASPHPCSISSHSFRAPRRRSLLTYLYSASRSLAVQQRAPAVTSTSPLLTAIRS